MDNFSLFLVVGSSADGNIVGGDDTGISRSGDDGTSSGSIAVNPSR